MIVDFELEFDQEKFSAQKLAKRIQMFESHESKCKLKDNQDNKNVKADGVGFDKAS